MADHHKFAGVGVGALLHDFSAARIIHIFQLSLQRKDPAGGFPHSHHEVLRFENVVHALRDDSGTAGDTRLPEGSDFPAECGFHKG